MKVYTVAALLAGATSAVVAQSLNDPCTHNTCAGATLSTNIILRCVDGKYQPGNCNDNLAGVPPVGVKSSALCYIYDNTADCSLNGVVYKADGSTAPVTTAGTTSATTSTTSTTTTTTAPATVTSGTTIVTVTVPCTTTTTTTTAAGTGSPTYPGNNTTPTVPTVPASTYTGAASTVQLAGGFGFAAVLGLLVQLL